MLIPSIDLLGGRIVQLVQGARQALAFDDFEPWVERFSRYPLVQVIDLDAAMRQGDNRALIEQFARRLPCQVGGGIRDAARARELLAAGAKRVILGSALFAADGVDTAFATRMADEIGAARLVFSVDSRGGRVAVAGWKASTALTPTGAMRELEPYCGAFLYTHIDGEGLMGGFPLALARELRGGTARQLIVAGGVTTREEIDALDALGVDAVAGMAIYTGRLAV